jgi:hypothetical protein
MIQEKQLVAGKPGRSIDKLILRVADGQFSVGRSSFRKRHLTSTKKPDVLVV